jgi:UDPglucose 6-dehydrogenase
VQALIRSAHDAGHEPHILNAVESVNDRQKQVLFRKMQRHFSGELEGRTIALWGLAFKPQTDDMREAPARTLIDLLLKAGARIQAYDPIATAEAQRIYGGQSGVALCQNAYEAAQGADALAIVTEWQEFRSPDFERLKEILKSPVIFDGRNLYDPLMVGRFGLTYYAIGRGKPLPADAVS